MDLLKPGTIIDERYEITSHISGGGMGEVFKALELGLGRTVAIKILHSGLIGDEENLLRFEREGKILSTISHRNLLMCYRFGIWNNSTPYIAMEYIEGTNLRKLIDQLEKIPLNRVLAIAAQVCEAMGHAHNHGVVHRDLTPNNVMLTSVPEQDTVKIIDFGLAKLLPHSAAENQQLTQTGLLIGSIFYMSPEQCLGKKSDSRADIYSLGCVLYEAATGVPPHQSDNPIGMMHKHVNETPKSLLEFLDSTQQVLALNTVLRRAMEREPDKRYQTMEEFGKDIESVRKGQFENIVPTATSEADFKHRGRKSHTMKVLAGSACFLSLAVVGFNFLPHRSTTTPKAEPGAQKKKQSLGITNQMAEIVKMPSGNERLLKGVELESRLNKQNSPINDDLVTTFYKNCATDLVKGKQHRKAVKVLENGIALVKEINGAPIYIIQMKMELGDVQLKLGDNVEAQRTFRSVYDVGKQLSSNRKIDHLRVSNGIAQALLSEGKFAEAEKVLLNEKSILSDNISGMLHLWPLLANAYKAQHKDDQELKLYDQFKFLRAPKSTYRDTSASLEAVLEILTSVGELAEAHRRIDECLPVYSKDAPESCVGLHFRKAQMYMAQAEGEKALDEQSKAIALCDRPSVPHSLKAAAYDSMAEKLLLLQRHAEAAKYTEAVIEQDCEGNIYKLQALTRAVEIALIQNHPAKAKGDFDRLDWYAKSQIKNLSPSDILEYYIRTARAFSASNLNDEAIVVMLRAVSLLESTKSKYCIDRANVELASFEFAMGNYVRSESILRRCIEDLLQQGQVHSDNPDQDKWFADYAKAASSLPNPAASDLLIENMLSKAKSTNDKFGLLLHAGDYFNQRALPQRARDCLLEAVEASANDKPVKYLSAILKLAKTYIALGQPNKTIEILNREGPQFAKLHPGIRVERQLLITTEETLAMAYERLEKNDEAKLHCYNASKICSAREDMDRLMHLRMRLVDLLTQEKKFDEARCLISDSRSLTSSPQYAAYRFTLDQHEAQVLSTEKKYQEALVALKKILKEQTESHWINSEHVSALDLAAEVSLAAGNRGEAKEYASKALTLQKQLYGPANGYYRKLKKKYATIVAI